VGRTAVVPARFEALMVSAIHVSISLSKVAASDVMEVCNSLSKATPRYSGDCGICIVSVIARRRVSKVLWWVDCSLGRIGAVYGHRVVVTRVIWPKVD
jgi:hypothetical protein